jgi:putative aminopeptidase FrvX
MAPHPGALARARVGWPTSSSRASASASGAAVGDGGSCRRSIHLTRGRAPAGEAPFTFDEAYVDVGALNAEEVTRLGIAELAPVALEKRPHRYGDGLLAAPVAGRRAACAALADAAHSGAAPAAGFDHLRSW